jgi:Holliday junction DNA helicase RuvA
MLLFFIDKLKGNVKNVMLNLAIFKVIEFSLSFLSKMSIPTLKKLLFIKKKKKIYVYTHNNMKNLYTLESLSYIFLSIKDRDLFIKLISLKGIGRDNIINLFSHFSRNEIIEKIFLKDERSLLKVVGLGKKRINKIFLKFSKNIFNFVEKKIFNKDISKKKNYISFFKYKKNIINTYNFLIKKNPNYSLKELIILTFKIKNNV